jgi:hypothetical protein
LEPSARVVVVTISIASGMEATMSTTVKERASTTCKDNIHIYIHTYIKKLRTRAVYSTPLTDVMCAK